jgi:hypothetical protein
VRYDLKFPLQTESPGPHTREYGCAACVGATIAQAFCEKALTPEEERQLIVDGTNFKVPNGPYGNKLIADNAIPVGQPGWMRVFVTNFPLWIKFCAASLGKNVDVKLPATFTPYQLLNLDHPIPANLLAIIVYKTEYHDAKGNLVHANHFALGRQNAATRAIEEFYNPWPGLKSVVGVQEYRFVSIEEVPHG